MISLWKRLAASRYLFKMLLDKIGSKVGQTGRKFKDRKILGLGAIQAKLLENQVLRAVLVAVKCGG